jgi:hypothetical protein
LRSGDFSVVDNVQDAWVILVGLKGNTQVVIQEGDLSEQTINLQTGNHENVNAKKVNNFRLSTSL